MANDVATNMFSATYTDYSKEQSTTTINTRALADNTAYEAAKTNLLNSFGVITNGLLAQTIDSKNDRLSNGFPTDDLAAREKKWLVTYEDTVNFKKFVFTVPTMDDTTVTFIPQTDFADLTIAPMDTVVSDIEAFVASPYGNPVNVLTIERVGRNN